MKTLKFIEALNSSKDVENWTLFLLRLTLTVVIFPHGAQLLLGWYGGFGYTETMNYFTNVAGLPYIIGFLVIMIQFVGALLLLLGVAVRINAFAMFVIFVGMIFTSHLDHGFFMNWFGNQKGEGFEYHILVLGITVALILKGSGDLALLKLINSK